jgi:predicted ArsR family transcriptional regulator
MHNRQKFAVKQSFPERIKTLAKTYGYDAEEISEILDLEVDEVARHMPKLKARYELVDLDTGRRWPAHSPRKAYLQAQIKGLTSHECQRAGQAS